MNVWTVAVAAILTMSGANAPDIATATPPVREIGPESWAQQRACISPAPVVVWSSRVGRGKTFGGCLNAYIPCALVPGVAAGVTRFELASMHQPGANIEQMQKLAGTEHWLCRERREGYEIGWREGDQTLYFPPKRCDDGVVRQSKIVFFGWKDPGRNLSSEYHRCVVDQAEQIEREHFTIAQTRVRKFDPWVDAQLEKQALRPRQVLLICNADDPDHWINLDFEVEEKGAREEFDAKGNLRYEVLLSQPDDNAQNLPPDYDERLESLRGTVFFDRLVGGRWARATGTVYGGVFDPAVHIIDRPAAWARWGGYPPPDWPRIRDFDFGFRPNPFTVGWSCEVRGSIVLGGGRVIHDGALIEYREGYHTGRTGSDWGDWINAEERKELITLRASIQNEDEARQYQPYLRKLNVQESWSDHDPEWRAELGKKGVWTQLADKDIETGIMAMVSALANNGLFFVRDALLEEDPYLLREKLPTGIRGEWSRYRYGPRPAPTTVQGHSKLNVPLDKDNHALDRKRYTVKSRSGAQRVAVYA